MGPRRIDTRGWCTLSRANDCMRYNAKSNAITVLWTLLYLCAHLHPPGGEREREGLRGRNVNRVS